VSVVPRTIDVSKLPSSVLDGRSLVWWGTVIMSVIEGMVFAIAAGAYFYLRSLNSEWPPPRTGPPGWVAATVNLAVLLGSLWPAVALDRAGRKKDARAVKLWLWVTLGFGTVFLVLRVFEFMALHCWWNSHAYGSASWTILGLHTSNLLTSLLETAIVLLYFTIEKPDEHHFLDARLDGVFWYFIVVTWIPLYAVVFLVPRFL
jgi:heme/copper-type cytochrome/quinol oxidase subunit 3